ATTFLPDRARLSGSGRTRISSAGLMRRRAPQCAPHEAATFGGGRGPGCPRPWGAPAPRRRTSTGGQENGMSEMRDAMHPRPQLTRARWIDLAGAWGFAYDDAGRGLEEGWPAREDVYTRTITVPFPPESPASGIGETGFHPVVWYRRTVRAPRQDAGRRLLLHCGAVDYRAQVWVNGHLVASHEGGHTPFSADITSVLRPDADQVIVVRAED